MSARRSLNSFLALGLAAAAAAGNACSGAGGGSSTESVVHPLLIVREADYADLRARAATSPWRELATEARRYAEQERFDPGASDFQAKVRMTDLCGALALAWVLEPAPALLDKLVATLSEWPGYFVGGAPASGTQVRWQQSAMVQSILALDVMREALDPADRLWIETLIDGLVREWWANLAQDGTTSTPGLVTIWALYAGDRALFEQARALYRQRLFGELTPSGVFDGGSGYAWVRYGGDRLSKYAVIDVLEFAGEDRTLYTDPRIRTLHEWMYAGAYTPMRTNLTFGDSDPSRPIEGLLGYWPPYRAALVSDLAGGNAAWLTGDVVPRPGLVSFKMLEPTLAPQPPRSTLWSDCATFWETGAAPDALMGALWSPQASGTHSHKDVNAVHLCAYGENVLVNSGYCGAGLGIDATFDWDWVFDTAASSNTVAIDGLDHAAKAGAGVSDGFCAAGFDYAASDSGAALPNGTHQRSLLLVHGELELPGYFVLLDEARAATPGPGTTVCLDLHPDSDIVSTVTPGLEYEWSIQRFGTTPVSLTLFLATVPDTVELRDGGLCAFDGAELVARALHACHAAPGADGARVVTIAFPHDARHPKPDFTALGAGGSYSGARLDYPSGVADVVLESSGADRIVLGAQAFRGRAAHFRVDAGGVRQYFVRRGRTFDDGATVRTGFDSDSEISTFMRGRVAHVSSTGAEVVYWSPDLVGDTFTTTAGTVLEAGPGFVRIALRPGTYAFDLGTGSR